MCFALVGKVLEFDGKNAKVDFEGVRKRVNSEFIKVKKGDNVLVFNNFVIERL
ncbi:MAG: HypC/HybG/HupF family hydrogenase formation chaperone [Candidatus Aenigmatarchaeota archaeon]|nr:MAG: HypC/HybG/HupF family hydrogenase formation chaperone [Candidatus Aenigmarchaeota archaeon]